MSTRGGKSKNLRGSKKNTGVKDQQPLPHTGQADIEDVEHGEFPEMSDLMKMSGGKYTIPRSYVKVKLTVLYRRRSEVRTCP